MNATASPIVSLSGKTMRASISPDFALEHGRGKRTLGFGKNIVQQ
jgi:hypothetical protein